jgi:hypothetical protein
MTKNKMYRYIGRNGIITSPVILDGINRIDMLSLKADEGMILSNGSKKVYSIIIEKEELEDWFEIPDETNK